MGAKNQKPRGPSARTIIADNLKAVMEHSGLSQTDIARKAGGEIQQSTVSRVIAEKHAADIDTLEHIAHAVGLTVWQMLVPKLDPSNPPVLQNATPQERELYDRLRAAAELLSPKRQ